MEPIEMRIDSAYIENVTEYHDFTIMEVNYDVNDFYFWMDDKFNPLKKKYFMVKRLKKLCRMK